MTRLAVFIVLFIASYFSATTFNSCAVMVPPTGGPRDSIAPKLLKSNPGANAVNVTTKTITLEFDEFVETEDAYTKIWITPAQEKTPEVKHKLRNVTIKLMDSLQPNTTYKITVNGAIKDVNEGNKLNDFDIVFSTGSTIDSNTMAGNVVQAETGKVDSTLIVGLYTNFTDSAVAKEKPKYIARLNSAGAFKFTNLPNRNFAIFAISDEGGQKKYTSLAQQFAFSDSLINTAKNPTGIKLYSYIQEREKPRIVPERANTDTKVKYNTNLIEGTHDLLTDLKITTARKLANVDTALIMLMDTLTKNKYAVRFTLDSNKKDISIQHNWELGKAYTIVIGKEALKDEKGNTLPKADTIRFATRAAKEYGKLTIRFNEVNFKKNPVLQILQNDKIVNTIAITNLKILVPLINSGNYEMRVLYDTNKNLTWDAGSFFGKKQQPELVLPLNNKLEIKADWDNEVDVDVPL